MSSIVSGFEYDIFISYRHNDNLDGWVTDFVHNLEKELKGTIKGPVSVYFDTNPADGLLEIHDVDKSLKDKLKCLIFIPIISQTYCDTKSFAWQHELCAFNKMAKEDQFGRDIKLSNGNVTSRILPIKIHDLDAEDKALLEKELDGVLRGIEFIYKEAGVNRPLKVDDRKQDNLNKTAYRNQVNKVANAVKELFSVVVKSDKLIPITSRPTESMIAPRFITKTGFAWVVGALLLLAVIIFIYFNGFHLPSDRKVIDKSIAVIPFTDISENHDQAYFSDGMMVEILDHLFKIEGLRIIPRNSTLVYKDSSKPLREIAKELGVANLILGSVRKARNQVKISVQLIDGTSEQYLWQQTYEREIEDVFSVQSDVAQQIASALKARVSEDVKKRIEAIPTANLEAYDFFLKGKEESNKYWSGTNSDHINKAIEFYTQAVSLDPKFSDGFTGLGQCYSMLGHYPKNYSLDVWKKSKEYLEKAIALDPSNGWAYAELGMVQNKYDWDRIASLHSLQKAVQLDPSNVDIHFYFILYYLYIQSCDEAAKELDIVKSINPGNFFFSEVAINMCKDQTDELTAMKVPTEFDAFSLFAAVERYMVIDQFEQALRLIEQEKKSMDTESMDIVWIVLWQGEALALSGKKNEAKNALQELEQLSKKRYVSQTFFASIYMALGEEDKAYQHLERALQERDGTSLHDLTLMAPFYKKRHDPRLKEFIERSWVPLKQ